MYQPFSEALSANYQDSSLEEESEKIYVPYKYHGSTLFRRFSNLILLFSISLNILFLIYFLHIKKEDVNLEKSKFGMYISEVDTLMGF